MASKRFFKWFLFFATGLSGVAPALPCLADMPPLGYIGPVPRQTAKPAMPPLGYVGPVPRPTGGVASKRAIKTASAALAASEEPVQQVKPVAQDFPTRSAVSPHTPPKAPTDTTSVANPKGQSGETFISAKKMQSDSETGVVTASGNVELAYKGYVMRADSIAYDRNTGVVRAEGNVVLQTPSGEVQFADRQEVSGDMKQAFAENVGILFPDNSRMSARSVVRYDERYSVADKAAYTACNICREDPDKKPLWQLRANTVTHDTVRRKVYYHDATIDFAGLPVLYTPYMSAPDPTVRRLQGFLSPVPGVSPTIGDYVKVPYYFDIAPNIDATLTPTFSTEDKLQVDFQYRQRFAKGKFLFSGSGTRAQLIDDKGVNKGEQWRGHLFSDYLTNINNIWRAGSEIQYVSDKSYLQRYKISSQDQTTSRVYAEGFYGRNYVAVNSYYFQDLRAGSRVAEPIVFPSATFSALGAPGKTLGGRWSFDGNSLITARNNTDKALSEQGPDTRRLSLKGGWERQYISDTGLKTTVSGLLRTDSYWANNIVTTDRMSVYDRALFTRTFQQANAVVRFPLGRSAGGYQQILEPIAALTLAPKMRSISKLPVEDGLAVEFDETNLFSPNRYSGSDLVEGGSRMTFGLRNAIIETGGAQLDVFGGRSVGFTHSKHFSKMTGLAGRGSDYVGRVDLAVGPWVNANYGFRLAEDDFSPQRQDAYISVGAPIFRPSARYIQAYQLNTAKNTYDKVQQIRLGLKSTFAKYWTISGTHTHSFDPEPGPRKSGVALTYADECFAFGINASHETTNRMDISSGTSVAFHFYLKNLGGLHTDSASGIVFPEEFRQTAP